jgi:hypothetical protein
VGGDPVSAVPTCRHCNVALGNQEEKALSGEVQEVWASVLTGEWVCEVTGDEHCPAHLPCEHGVVVAPPGTWIVVEGDPVNGFIFHGIPAFADEDAAERWAVDNCTESAWVAPLQDVE